MLCWASHWQTRASCQCQCFRHNLTKLLCTLGPRSATGHPQLQGTPSSRRQKANARDIGDIVGAGKGCPGGDCASGWSHWEICFLSPWWHLIQWQCWIMASGSGPPSSTAWQHRCCASTSLHERGQFDHWLSSSISSSSFQSSERAEGNESPSKVATLTNQTSRTCPEDWHTSAIFWRGASNIAKHPDQETWSIRADTVVQKTNLVKKSKYCVVSEQQQQACSGNRDLVQIYSIRLYALTHI